MLMSALSNIRLSQSMAMDTAGKVVASVTIGKGENPFIHMRSVCVTYAVCIYETFSTFNALNMFAAVQWKTRVN